MQRSNRMMQTSNRRDWAPLFYMGGAMVASLLLSLFDDRGWPSPLTLYPAPLALAAMVAGWRGGIMVLAVAFAHTAVYGAWDNGVTYGPLELLLVLVCGALLLVCGVAIRQWHARQMLRAETLSTALASFLDGLPAGLLIVDRNGRPYYSNRRADALLGRGLDLEASAPTLAASYGLARAGEGAAPYPADDLPLLRALGGAAVQADDLEVARPDGTRAALEMGAAPVLDDTGVPAYSVAVLRDITERRANETQLRESAERVQSIFLSMVEGVVLQDATGAIIECNPAAEAILGLSRDQMLGRTSVDPRWRTVRTNGTPYPGEYHPAMRTLATGQPVRSDVMGVHRPDGSLVWISINTQPLMGEDSRPTAVVVTFVDITESRRRDLELRQANRRLTAIIDASPTAIYTLTPEATVDTWNAAAERIFGWTQAEVRGRPLQIIPFESAGQRDAIIGALRAGTILNNMEVRRRRKDGEIIDVSLSVAPLDTDGGAVSVAEDITERKRIERELVASREDYRLLVDQASDIVYRTDINGYFTFCNPTAERITEYPASTLVGTRFTALIPPPHRGVVARNLMRQYLDRTRNSYQEFPIVTGTGRTVWVGQNVTLNLDDRGEPTGFQAIARDISDRRRAEEGREQEYHAAEQARSELRSVLDAAFAPMLVVLLDGTMRTANRRLYDMFPTVTHQAVEDQPLASLTEAFSDLFEDGPGLVAWLQAAMAATGSPTPLEAVQVHPVHRNFSVMAGPVAAPDGGPVARLFAFRDVTQERDLERMKDQFISMVSHELRTPLTSILGYTELLLDGVGGEVAAPQRNFLTVVLNNARRQLNLVNDLLDFSRLNEGRLEMHPSTVDMAALVQAVAASLQPQCLEKALDLRVEVEPGAPHAWADPQRVTQVMTNLVSNAVKYTPQGGRITIRVSRHGEGPRVDVQDTGIGLSEEDQAKVFSRFFRSRNALAQAAAGTGLGLAISKALVEQQGGAITFSSRLHQGSTFTFTLPPATQGAVS